MPVQLRVEREWLHAALSESIERYENMRGMPVNTAADRMALLAAFRSWDERNKRLLDQAFTPVPWHETSPKSDYTDLKDVHFSLLEELATTEEASDLGRLADEKRRRLESLRDSLDLFVASPRADSDATEDPSAPADASRTIFLVHGRDKAAREEVHRFLARVLDDTEVTVLAEQPNQGQTLVEKLEAHLPTAAYAVVVATADDEGRLRGEGELALRARQNVVLELGLAIGALGRRNVSLLYEDGVELPSDYYGVVYTPFDAGGGWKLALIGELKAAGFAVDANRALG